MDIQELQQQFNSRLYAIHDYDSQAKKQEGAFTVAPGQATELNNKGYGIFWTPNEFKNKVRKQDNLVAIHYWLADIDCGTKEEQLKNILKLRIKPTMIVETKKGYHCYWKAKNGTRENYKTIELGLIKLLNADPACKDNSRLLRVPGYKHCKDPNNIFNIKLVHLDNREITEAEMLYVYDIPEKAPITKPTTAQKKIFNRQYNTNNEKYFLENNKNFYIENATPGQRHLFMDRATKHFKDKKQELNFSYDVAEEIKDLNNKLSQPLDNEEIESIIRSNKI